MSFSIIYKNLFEIRLLHHYFLDKGELTWDKMDQKARDQMEARYDVRDFFEIAPTPDCINMLRSNSCIFKLTSTGILVGIKAIPDANQPQKFKPFIPLNNDLTFRFSIRLKDPNFSSYTALPLQGNEGKMFIFKNFALNNPLKFPSLSAIPPLYKPGAEYQPGDMLSDQPVNQTKLFTALVKTKNITSVAGDWLTETGNATTPLGYANVNDRYPVANGIFFYTMKEKDILPLVTMKNFAGETVNPKQEIIQGEFYSIQADMRNFPQGFYSAQIEGNIPGYLDNINFYLLQQNGAPFGWIEIKVKSGQPEYNLVDQGLLLSPAFELRFRNRRTFWRYFGKILSAPFEVQDSLPLTRYGQIEIIKPPAPEDTNTILLPNPSGPLIRPEALIKTNENKYYTDIYII